MAEQSVLGLCVSLCLHITFWTSVRVCYAHTSNLNASLTAETMLEIQAQIPFHPGDTVIPQHDCRISLLLSLSFSIAFSLCLFYLLSQTVYNKWFIYKTVEDWCHGTSVLEWNHLSPSCTNVTRSNILTTTKSHEDKLWGIVNSEIIVLY